MMESMRSSFTILFEGPFWIGVYEAQEGSHYEVCKITFGPEPKDCEVYELILKKWSQLERRHYEEVPSKLVKPMNPKKMQRAIKRELQNTGMGTKAQQALKEQQEQNKIERKSRSRLQKEAEKQYKFDLKQEKRKEKHRGH